MPTTSAENEALRVTCLDLCSQDGGQSSPITGYVPAATVSTPERRQGAAVSAVIAEGIRQLSVYCSPRATRRSIHDGAVGGGGGFGRAGDPLRLVDKQEQWLGTEVDLFTTLALHKPGCDCGGQQEGTPLSDSGSQRSASRLSTCAPSDFTGAVSWEGGVGSVVDSAVSRRRSRGQLTVRVPRGANVTCAASSKPGSDSSCQSSRLRRTNSNPENLLLAGRKGALLKDSRSCTNLQRYVLVPSPAARSGTSNVTMATGKGTKGVGNSLLEQDQEEEVYGATDGLSPLSPFVADQDDVGCGMQPQQVTCRFRMASLSRSTDNLCDNTDRVRQWLQGVEPAAINISSCAELHHNCRLLCS